MKYTVFSFLVLGMAFAGFSTSTGTAQESAPIVVHSLSGLAALAAKSDQSIKMEPGVYRMADYLTEEVLRQIHAGVDRSERRPTVPMFVFSGSNNRFDFRGVVLEIDTSLYKKLPSGGYVRCLFVPGNNNVFDGLTIRNTGPNQGSGGNIFAIFGEDNTVENTTLHVHGSFPYGYGDLLGKGSVKLVSLQKQSGIQIRGSRTLLRRCKVISRAFGHCFYIQAGDGASSPTRDIRLEDCYAEGVMRPTAEMLRETSGPAYDLNFKSVYENRDGRFLITPGYMKSLVEDGFRTYAGVGNVTLINCVAINTRAGFEIGAADDSPAKTLIENGTALGCERGYLLGSKVVVRRSRGDMVNGPLLYLRGGLESDIDLELVGGVPRGTVHALATIAGSNHRVRLTTEEAPGSFPLVPVMVGFGMPAHGEMASPILPAPTSDIHLINEIPHVTVIVGADTRNVEIETVGRTLTEEDARQVQGSGAWPAGDGMAR